MWAWGNDSGGWNPMPGATSATLEQAFQALPHDANAPARVTYDVDQGDRVASYELDFRKMKQTNLATSFKRAVRRFQAPAGARQAGQPPRIWAWEMDDGGYWPCDADHSEFLSLVQAKGWRAARYWTDRCVQCVRVGGHRHMGLLDWIEPQRSVAVYTIHPLPTQPHSHTQYEASLLPQSGIMTQRNRETGRVRGLAVDVALGGAGGQPASVPQMVDALLARCRDVTAVLAAQAQQQQQQGGGAGDGDDEADQDVCLSTWWTFALGLLLFETGGGGGGGGVLTLFLVFSLPASLPRGLHSAPRPGAAGLPRPRLPPRLPQGLARALLDLPRLHQELRPAHRWVGPPGCCV